MIKRILRNLKESKLAIISLILIGILCLACIFAFLSPYDPNKIDLANRLKPPSLKHLFGTDDMGRDYFTRALYGGRVSLTVGFSVMIIATAIGTLVGTISGYLGGIVDSLIMRTLDILMSIPTFFLILILNIYLKPSIWTIVIIISLFSWMDVARIIRSETLSIKEREYVTCAISQGIPSFKIILTHIVISVIPSVMVAASINVASAILMESSLSFLGLGIQPPNASWGSMLQKAQEYMMDMPTLAVFPGVLILITVLSFNVLGDLIKESFQGKNV